nr:recombinase family protein [uncultured Corynebacterium sp.]
MRSILSNEKYKGDALLKKTFTTDFLTKRMKVNEGEVPQYYVSGNHEPIIAPRIWDQVQYELATRHGNISSAKVGLFSTRLKCAQCGAWYGRKTWASNTKYKYTVLAMQPQIRRRTSLQQRDYEGRRYQERFRPSTQPTDRPPATAKPPTANL